MQADFLEALEELERERGIRKEVLLSAIEAALLSAYRRNFSSAQNARVEIDPQAGEFHVYAQKEVVEHVDDPRLQIALDDARQVDPRYEVGDILEQEVTPHDFGRVAAQTAKQVVMQRIREAERGLIYEEFLDREEDVMSGLVQRQDARYVFVNLGKAEALLPQSETLPTDHLRTGDRIKVLITRVERSNKGPQIYASRTHPTFVKRLLELEVPEIYNGIVEIRSVARDPGYRCKVAVYSNNDQVDPVGACIGPRGQRIQAVVNELRGEKIDVIAWSIDPEEFVANALAPAKPTHVWIDDEHVARVTVPDAQLSLAIGKEGQNARLAAKLTGWKIDIRGESDAVHAFDLEALPNEENDR